MRFLSIIFFTILTAASSAQNLPFPQHYPYKPGYIKPSDHTQAQLDNDVKNFYDAWKDIYFRNDCGTNQYYVWMGDEDPAVNGVSEGQGYGMMIAAYMAGYDASAQTVFDGLYNYYKAHPSINNSELMAWEQDTACNDINGADAATDGDLDIAYALLLADRQWGSSGTINYLQQANAIISAIKVDETNPITHSVKLGDWTTSGDSYYYSTRPSDFMPDHFKAFYNATSDNTWNQVTDECYVVDSTIQANNSPVTGLIPDFVINCNTTPSPAPANFLESAYDSAYNYNSCRVPWRITTDYLISGDTRAMTTVSKINSWIESHTSNDPSQIYSGFLLDGSDIPGNDYDDPSFIGPFAVGAMLDASHQGWMNDIYDFLMSESFSANTYFGNTLKLLSMIVISGNYWPPYDATAVNNYNYSEQIKVFPNPSEGIVNIESCTGAQIQLTNVSGQMLNDSKMTEYRTSINISSFEKGIYILKIVSNNFSSTVKLVKE